MRVLFQTLTKKSKVENIGENDCHALGMGFSGESLPSDFAGMIANSNQLSVGTVVTGASHRKGN